MHDDVGVLVFVGGEEEAEGEAAGVGVGVGVGDLLVVARVSVLRFGDCWSRRCLLGGLWKRRSGRGEECLGM